MPRIETKVTQVMPRSESAPRFYSYRGQAKRTGKASALLESVEPQRSNFGASSSALYPIQSDSSTGQQLPTARRRHRTYAKPRVVLPVDSDAVVIALGLLAAYVAADGRVDRNVLAALAGGNTVSLSAVQPVAVVPAVVVPADVIPTAPPPPSRQTSAESALAARRAKALELLKKTRSNQSDTVVYRQGLAELVRSYSDTPAEAEALRPAGRA